MSTIEQCSHTESQPHCHTSEDKAKTGVSDKTERDGGWREEKKGDMMNNNRRCRGPTSKLAIFSFIVMVFGFTLATPFSLLLTIPAYILADQASTYTIRAFMHTHTN